MPILRMPCPRFWMPREKLGPRRVITVFGCGGDRDRGKRPLMTRIATEKSNVVILTSDNPRTEDPVFILNMLAGIGWTMQDYLKHGENGYCPPLPNGHRLFVHEKRRVAVRAAVAMGQEGDIVIVAGKGHEQYQIEGDKRNTLMIEKSAEKLCMMLMNCAKQGQTSEFPFQ